MKTMLKISALIFLFCLTAQFARAQDIIYKKTKKSLKVKVKEIGLDEVKYVKYEDQDGVIYSIAKDAILKIKFENGETEYFISDFDNPEYYADQKRRAIKFNFFSPLFGHSEFAFENNLAPGRSIEAKVGFVGLGKNLAERDARGLYLGASYKFYHKPSYYMRGMHYAHILKGGYIRPEIIFGSYSENDPNKVYNSGERRTVNFGSLMINVGKQWVYSDFFLLDMYLGLGYGFDSVSNGATHNFSNVRLGEGVSIAIATGFRIGILIK